MITLSGIDKIFNENSLQEFKALQNINLEIEDGETIILSGVSGSGKSTLLSIIASLDRPTNGMVNINGELVSKLPDYHASLYRSKEIGFIFQHFNLLESLTVKDNILAPLIPLNIDILEANKMVSKAMKKAYIEHKASQSIRELSGGEKQRCAIARALVREPNIIICDEPTANLDKDNSLKFIEILYELHCAKKTIIVATHDTLFQNLNFNNRDIYMEDGKIK